MNVAICLRGAIAKVTGTFFTEGSLYQSGQYINYKACYNSIIKHIVNANSNCHFDFFIHCWNLDLKNDLVALYNPKKWSFEDNVKYNNEIAAKTVYANDFSGISHSLSIQKSIELMEQYQEENNFKYDLIISYRPDVIILKDMNINMYDIKYIYVNGHSPPDPIGDFHFVMNSQLASQFKYLYNSIELGNSCKAHFWISNYITKYMKQEFKCDNIIAGTDQEVLRKINLTMIQNKQIPIEAFYQYGLTKEEIETYNIP